MKAKYIYEAFKEESDPIEDMEIGQRALIHQWFKTYTRNVKYIIDDNLKIFVEEDLFLFGSYAFQELKTLAGPGNVGRGADARIGDPGEDRAGRGKCLSGKL